MLQTAQRKCLWSHCQIRSIFRPFAAMSDHTSLCHTYIRITCWHILLSIFTVVWSLRCRRCCCCFQCKRTSTKNVLRKFRRHATGAPSVTNEMWKTNEHFLVFPFTFGICLPFVDSTTRMFCISKISFKKKTKRNGLKCLRSWKQSHSNSNQHSAVAATNSHHQLHLSASEGMRQCAWAVQCGKSISIIERTNCFVFFDAKSVRN